MSEGKRLHVAAVLLSPQAVADLLGIRPQSLRVRRMRSQGPPFIRLGNSLASRPRYTGTCEEKAAECGSPQ
jgi:hypothetical protein